MTDELVIVNDDIDDALVPEVTALDLRYALTNSYEEIIEYRTYLIKIDAPDPEGCELRDITYYYGEQNGLDKMWSCVEYFLELALGWDAQDKARTVGELKAQAYNEYRKEFFEKHGKDYFTKRR